MQVVGERVRARRLAAGYTLKQLATRSGLSARFISEVEAGRANISVEKLSSLADSLGVTAASLLTRGRLETRAAIDDHLDRCDAEQLEQIRSLIEVALGVQARRVLALIGIRGSGKSSVGRLAAASLSLPFVELDERIEGVAGMTTSDIFTLYGEPRYRTLEQRCLAELLEGGERCVVALPGGVVTNPDALRLLRSGCHSVWLRASPSEYWRRVFAQGDQRPMRGQDDAMADLRALIARRRPLYAQADLTVNTTDRTPAEVAQEIVTWVQATQRGEQR